MGTHSCFILCAMVLGLVAGQVTQQPQPTQQALLAAYNNIRQQIGQCVGEFICEVTSASVTTAGYLSTCKVACIPWAQRCNGRNDCANGKDEEGCPPPSTCTASGRYTCGNGRTCADLCDGVKECEFGEDELGCGPGCHCHPGTYLCADNSTCIMPTQICDGTPNCPAGDDEAGCPPTKCSASEYRCVSGHCIPRSQVCDGIQHCMDGEDESRCRDTNCGAGEYRCANNITCLPKTQFCDRVPQCPDKDDEACCGHNCGPGTFVCSAANGQQNCIPKALVCDGVNDCAGAVDEEDCPVGCSCAPGHYLCMTSGRCIGYGQLCDDTTDCVGIEDENIPTGDIGCFDIAS